MKTTFHGIAQNARRMRVVRLRGGLPAFDDNAPGNKGWHIVKETVNGVESLKLFWQLGLTITIH